MSHGLHGLFTDGILSKNYKKSIVNFYPKIIENYNKLLKIVFLNKNTLRYKNYKKSIVIFWFAQKGNSLPGEQNKNRFL